MVNKFHLHRTITLLSTKRLYQKRVRHMQAKSIKANHCTLKYHRLPFRFVLPHVEDYQVHSKQQQCIAVRCIYDKNKAGGLKVVLQTAVEQESCRSLDVASLHISKDRLSNERSIMSIFQIKREAEHRKRTKQHNECHTSICNA